VQGDLYYIFRYCIILPRPVFIVLTYVHLYRNHSAMTHLKQENSKKRWYMTVVWTDISITVPFAWYLLVFDRSCSQTPYRLHYYAQMNHILITVVDHSIIDGQFLVLGLNCCISQRSETLHCINKKQVHQLLQLKLTKYMRTVLPHAVQLICYKNFILIFPSRQTGL